MSDRRRVLAAGAAAIPDLAVGWTPPEPADAAACASSPGARIAGGRNAGYIPNVVVETHERRRALFYDDLLLGRAVMINFMSVANDAVYSVTANLARVQPYLGDRLGRDVFMYSLTVDPEHDTPEVLRAFAARHGARPGWLFLTGDPADMELLRGRLYAHNGPHHPGLSAKDCSRGLARYGNEAIGLWGSVPARSNPEWIARRLSWVAPREPTAAPFKRRGPAPATYRT